MQSHGCSVADAMKAMRIMTRCWRSCFGSSGWCCCGRGAVVRAHVFFFWAPVDVRDDARNSDALTCLAATSNRVGDEQRTCEVVSTAAYTRLMFVNGLARHATSAGGWCDGTSGQHAAQGRAGSHEDAVTGRT